MIQKYHDKNISLILTVIKWLLTTFRAFCRLKSKVFLLEKRPRLCLGLSKWICMEVVNINNDRGVISIPRLKPRALITPGSLLIHYS